MCLSTLCPALRSNKVHVGGNKETLWHPKVFKLSSITGRDLLSSCGLAAIWDLSCLDLMA